MKSRRDEKFFSSRRLSQYIIRKSKSEIFFNFFGNQQMPFVVRMQSVRVKLVDGICCGLRKPVVIQINIIYAEFFAFRSDYIHVAFKNS